MSQRMCVGCGAVRTCGDVCGRCGYDVSVTMTTRTRCDVCGGTVDVCATCHVCATCTAVCPTVAAPTVCAVCAVGVTVAVDGGRPDARWYLMVDAYATARGLDVVETYTTRGGYHRALLSDGRRVWRDGTRVRFDGWRRWCGRGRPRGLRATNVTRSACMACGWRAGCGARVWRGGGDVAVSVGGGG